MRDHLGQLPARQLDDFHPDSEHDRIGPGGGPHDDGQRLLDLIGRQDRRCTGGGARGRCRRRERPCVVENGAAWVPCSRRGPVRAGPAPVAAACRAGAGCRTQAGPRPSADRGCRQRRRCRPGSWPVRPRAPRPPEAIVQAAPDAQTLFAGGDQSLDHRRRAAVPAAANPTVTRTASTATRDQSHGAGASLSPDRHPHGRGEDPQRHAGRSIRRVGARRGLCAERRRPALLGRRLRRGQGCPEQATTKHFPRPTAEPNFGQRPKNRTRPETKHAV